MFKRKDKYVHLVYNTAENANEWYYLKPHLKNIP